MADDQCFGARYLQLARAQRLDVTTICSGLVPARWYRASLATQGLEIPPSTGSSLGDALLRSGRPVFSIPALPALFRRIRLYQFGIVLRLLPVGVPAPSPSKIAIINRDLYRTFDLDYTLPDIDDGYAAVAHHRYAASWAAIARALSTEGDRTAVNEALELTRALQPTTE